MNPVRFRLVLLLGASLLGACAPHVVREPGGIETPTPGTTQPVTPPRPSYTINDPSKYPRTAEAVSSPAALKLLRTGRAQLSGGKPDQAVATLETAIDIDKRNPFVWSALAQAHLVRNLPEEAENVAKRSNSFARGNPWVEVENWRTIASARAKRGDTAGADEATAHYEAIAARLAE